MKMIGLAVFILISWRASAQAGEVSDVITQCRKVCEALRDNVDVALERRTGVWRPVSVKVHALNMKETDLAELSTLASIETLDIGSENPIPADAIQKIGVLPRLRHLKVSGSLSGKAFASLFELRTLKALDISEIGRLDEPFSANLFANIDNLVNLRHLKGPIVPSVLSFVKRLKMLEGLEIVRGNETAYPNLSDLKDLTSLRVLNVDELDEAGLLTLTNLPRLDRLSMSTDERLDLSVLRGVTSLRIFVRQKVRQIRLPVNLRDLDLPRETVAKLDLTSAKHIESLHFDIGNTGRFNKESGHPDKVIDLAWLRSLPELAAIEVREPIDSDLKQIANLTSLRTLTVRSGCPAVTYTDVGMEAITDMKGLECLEIENGWEVTDVGLKSLCNEKTLRRLGLTGYFPKLTVKGLDGVCALRRLRSLKLEMSENVRERSLDVVLPRIKGLGELEELSLKGSVTDDWLASLADIKTLRRLDLAGVWGYTDKGLASLMDALPKLAAVKVTILHNPPPALRNRNTM